MVEYHIAQINIARMLAPIDDPIMADFVAQLPPVNALADQSPGFVWRLQSESGDATSIKVYDDEFIIVNLTVWERIEALREYVYKGEHHKVLRDRKRWFEKFDGPYYALWWVPAGELPSIEEGKARLDHLREHGDSAYAFSFKHVFANPREATNNDLLTSPSLPSAS
ncbi:MAG TPA: DUF3291 domain-containing protein [Anaerolineales bacterium]|nr:DUF3291 domain-containing protein [Anaerolineales bacterium]